MIGHWQPWHILNSTRCLHCPAASGTCCTACEGDSRFQTAPRTAAEGLQDCGGAFQGQERQTSAQDDYIWDSWNGKILPDPVSQTSPDRPPLCRCSNRSGGFQCGRLHTSLPAQSTNQRGFQRLGRSVYRACSSPWQASAT